MNRSASAAPEWSGPSYSVDPAQGRILIVVPSRDRPKKLAHLVHSILDTSEHADVVAYVDEDQRELYGWLERLPGEISARVRVFFGPRVGPVAATNRMVSEALETHEVFAFLTDDCSITTHGWDRGVLAMLTNRIGIVAPAHATEDLDLPFVSRGWVRALGYFAWPGLYHWGWPSVTAALAAATRTVTRSAPGDFYIDHPAHESMNRERYPSDIIALYDFFACHFDAALEDLRRSLP